MMVMYFLIIFNQFKNMNQKNKTKIVNSNEIIIFYLSFYQQD